MLGEYEIAGIEAIESAERRTLVEHRVPGMDGSYLQDLGSAPNAITIAGTRYGDDARDSFLQSVRDLFGSGAPTTFTADINTATDLTDVVIEDLQVAELAGEADSFRYLMRLRKYVPPPEPPAAGLAGIDSDLLDAAEGLAGALDVLDTLGSVPNLGDPTPPLRGSLDGVKDATGDLPGAASDAQAGLAPGAASGGPAPVAASGESLPAKDEVAGSLDGVKGDADAGTGAAGALAALERADVSGKQTALTTQLDQGLSGALPDAGAAPGAEAVQQVGAAAEGVPDPEALSAPLAGPLGQIQALTGPEAAGAVPAAIDTLAAIGKTDGATALPAAPDVLGGFEHTAL